MTRTIQSVATTCKITEYLREWNGGTVSELANETGLTPGTVHTHLSTLREHNYVVKNGNEYRLGYHLLALGESVRNHQELYLAGKEQIESLAEETGECAHLIIEHDGQMYTLYERFGQKAVGVEYHDRKREQPVAHLHCTAAGKAILSRFSDELVIEIMADRGMPQVSENTITDIDELLDELESVRDRGYAIANEEQMEGIRAVGAPIKRSRDENAGGIAVSAPTARLEEKRLLETLPDKIMQAANICEVNLRTDQRQISG